MIIAYKEKRAHKVTDLSLNCCISGNDSLINNFEPCHVLVIAMG